ncbi:MAG: hypothetical protein KAU20_05245, partial [Nanoarchaeota archaeon]|nr:hypothetical protein [Nanoarchaeota archaeon]
TYPFLQPITVGDFVSNLQCYSESTIKQQGSYSLKAIAKQTDSLNDNLTRTVSPTINLSGKDSIKLDARANRTGSNFKISLHNSGGTPDSLDNVQGVHYDSNSGFLYITDRSNNRIIKTRIDSTGWTVLEGFNSPHGIYYDDSTEYIYVVQSHSVVKTKIDGSGWTVYGEYGSGTGQFHYPGHIVYSAPHFYISDNHGHRIIKTQLDGSWTDWQTISLTYSSGVFYDSVNDKVYGNEYHSGGNYIKKGTMSGWTDTLTGFSASAKAVFYDSSTDYIYVGNGNSLVKTKMNGSGWTELSGFTNIQDVYYDSSTEYLYIADIEKVVKTKIDGTGWTTLNGTGSSGTTEHTVNITSADTWQTETWNISGVSNANKDAIDQIKITILDADADAYVDITSLRAGASAYSAEPAYPVSKAFDGNTAPQEWYQSLAEDPVKLTDLWFKTWWSSGQVVKKMRYYSCSLTSKNIKYAKLEGSNDDSTWTKVPANGWSGGASQYNTDEILFSSDEGWKEVTFDNSVAYKYYRLWAYDTWVELSPTQVHMAIAEIEFYKEISGGTNEIYLDNLRTGDSINPQINISLRDCNDPACSDDAWDITCDNSTLCDISSLANSQYIQYKAKLETDDVDYTPQLNTSSVVIGFEEVIDTAPPLSCFPPGTRISMPDSTYKKIEDIKIGEFVLSYNEKNKINVPAKVLELESPIRDHMCRISFSDDSQLELTNEHPIYTINSWKSINPQETYRENPALYFVSKLNIRDKALFKNLKYKEITEITCWKEKIQTYNLKSIEEFNNFYAEDVLVHNKGPVPPPPDPCEGVTCDDTV